MLLQFWHSSDYDYEKELYEPIRQSNLTREHEIILPHEHNPMINSKETLQKVDVFFAEVSSPSIGLGIELGYADMYGKKIICFSKKGAKITSALKYVCKDFFEYTNAEDMIQHIQETIKNI